MLAATRTLEPILWDLRSELEAQMRCLTKTQLLLAELDLQPVVQRAADVGSILLNLNDICRQQSVLDPLCVEALAVASRLELLPPGDRS